MHHPAAEFIASWFAGSTGRVYLASLPNPELKGTPEGEPNERHVLTRSSEQAANFTRKWDRPGRAVYWGPATLKADAAARVKENIENLIALHVDVDFKDAVESPDEVERIVENLPLPPTCLRHTGHGLQGFWRYEAPIAATPESVAEHERLQRLLADHLGGDRAAWDACHLMRLPGTTNSKNGDKIPVRELAYRPEALYSLEALRAWLENAKPAIHRKGDAGNGSSPDNPFEAVAKEAGADKAPLDVDQAFANMVYLGPGGGGNAHDTLLRCSAAMIARGEAPEAAIARALDELGQAATRSGTPFNPERERGLIEQMVEGAVAKEFGSRRAERAGDESEDAVEAAKAVPKLVFVDMSRWDLEPTPEQEWAVRDRVPRRECVLFSGEGGAGKSIGQLHLSAASVLSREWLGAVPEQGPAIFIDAEDDEKVLHRRLKAIAKHYDVDIAEMIRCGLHLASWRGLDATLASVRNGKIEPTRLYRSLLEAAGDIKPIMIGIAASANVFAGNENDRAQVQQFVGLLTRVAMVANGSIVLISHPSLTGISTESGLSGTTQWHNAVRARFFLRGVKPEAGEPLDTDLRELVFKKNNYGPVSESVVLQWSNGLFLPVPGAAVDQVAKQAIAQEIFVALLKRFRGANRNVSDKPSVSYAPALFAREEEAKRVGLSGKDLEAAMRQLFNDGKIWNEPFGSRPSRPSYRIAIK